MSSELAEATGNNQHYETLISLITSHWIARALSTAVEYGIPDALRTGKSSLTELAQDRGVDRQALQRLLRALASVGVCEERAQDVFVLTAVGELLCADHPCSLNGYCRYMGADWQWREWLALPHSLLTGQPAFDKLFGSSFYQYMKGHPEDQSVFNAGMADISRIEAEAIIEGYDFSKCRCIMDAAGGTGRLLARILKAYPALRGILMDLPAVVAEAGEVLAPVADRCQLVGGDFYREVPSGADLCIIKRTLWSTTDAKVVEVVANCHRALPRDGKLLIIEPIITSDPEGSRIARLFDLLMLAQPGGRARTEAEYRTTLEAHGFSNVHLIPLEAGLSILEATNT